MRLSLLVHGKSSGLGWVEILLVIIFAFFSRLHIFSCS
jgi:hypothetical protein